MNFIALAPTHWVLCHEADEKESIAAIASFNDGEDALLFVEAAELKNALKIYTSSVRRNRGA